MSAKNVMLVSADPNETRVAILEDGRVAEHYIERARRSVAGNVYVGRVRDVLPGMQAAFVDIGLEKNAFLYVDDVIAKDRIGEGIRDLLRVGQPVLVQVVKDPMGTKGARVTMNITLPGRFLVLMPMSDFVGVSRKLPDGERGRLQDALGRLAPEDIGLIARTAAAGTSERELGGDLEFLTRLWSKVREATSDAVPPEVVYTEMDLALRLVRDVFDEGFTQLIVDDKAVFDKVASFLKKTAPHLSRRLSLYRERTPLFQRHGVNAQISAALKRRVPLPSGGSIVVDKTEALTAIDVNTGKYVGGANLDETILRTNLEAADEVVRQLRLRDIGGLIVVDFIDMDDQFHRAEVFARFSKAVATDRTKTRVLEFSPLGLIEMTRKNVSDGLHEVVTEECMTCGGAGRVLSKSTRIISVERRMRELLLSGRSPAYLFGLNPEVYDLVTAPGNNVVATLRSESGKHVGIMPDPAVEGDTVKVLIEGRVGLVKQALE